MADILRGYGPSNQVVICTLDALANGAARASTNVDNNTPRFLDALVSLNITAGATLAGEQAAIIYAYGTVDNGATYSGGATGTDAAFTIVIPGNLKTLGAVAFSTPSVIHRGGPFSIANAFGGVLPMRWGIVVENQSGSAFGTGCTVRYQGLYAIA